MIRIFYTFYFLSYTGFVELLENFLSLSIKFYLMTSWSQGQFSWQINSFRSLENVSKGYPIL